MEKRKMIQICICCSCFLAVIYGIARLDKVHRRYKNDEITTMAEKKSKQEIFTPQRIMYITFEDGPGLYTQDILYILDRYDVKATFFVTGMDQEYTHLLKDIQQNGHAVGLHSFSHDEQEIYRDVDAYFNDLGKISALVKKETSDVSKLIRFPMDSSMTVSTKQENMSARLMKHCENLGFSFYNWNVDSEDENPNTSKDQIYKNVIDNIKGKEEVVLRLHDGSDNKNTMLALDEILKELIRQGWEFRILEGA